MDRSRRARVAFVHAHPDDEAIFTGGTMALLAEAGHEVVLCVATSGELGVSDGDKGDLARAREQETRRCCAELGVEQIVFLRRQDSGLRGQNPHGLAYDDIDAVTELAAAELTRHGAIDALVGYDESGIYGHPDHVQVHRLGQRLQAQLGVSTRYDSTVDREYLHFVETHVVVEAGLGQRPKGRGLAASNLGLPSVLIDVTVDAGSVLDAKRLAMAAHASQLPIDAPAFALGQHNFAAVYGYEWYVRHGRVGPIDRLPLA